jgi:hypothetical protein
MSTAFSTMKTRPTFPQMRIYLPLEGRSAEFLPLAASRLDDATGVMALFRPPQPQRRS